MQDEQIQRLQSMYIRLTPDLNQGYTPNSERERGHCRQEPSCGNKKMDENMYSTLKADKNQIIKYTLSGYDILNGSATAFAAKTGTLTILGKEKQVAMKIDATRLNDGKATAEGEEPSSCLTSASTAKLHVRTMRWRHHQVRFNLKAAPR